MNTCMNTGQVAYSVCDNLPTDCEAPFGGGGGGWGCLGILYPFNFFFTYLISP